MSEIIAIAERFEPRIRRALMSAFEAMRGRTSLAQIQQRLETRGVTGVMALLDNIGEDLQPVVDELRNALAESGRMTLGLMPKSVVVNPRFAFDLVNPNTIAFIRRYELNLIQEISSSTRDAVQASITRDIISGRNPVDTARAFRASIGLAPKQEQAVANYRKALEESDISALQRKLRDGRFDGLTRRAIEAKRPLSKAQVDKMVTRYRERMIQYRTKVIARTESLRATTIGQQESIKQMVGGGAIEDNKLRKFWVATHDARTRDAHAQVPDLNPDGVPMDGAFLTPLGMLRFPRDPDGTAANTIQCRCTLRYAAKEH
jgi:hypothetical protein